MSVSPPQNSQAVSGEGPSTETPTSGLSALKPSATAEPMGSTVEEPEDDDFAGDTGLGLTGRAAGVLPSGDRRGEVRFGHLDVAGVSHGGVAGVTGVVVDVGRQAGFSAASSAFT